MSSDLAEYQWCGLQMSATSPGISTIPDALTCVWFISFYFWLNISGDGLQVLQHHLTSRPFTMPSHEKQLFHAGMYPVIVT